jgi:hypothetical protein
MPRRPAPITQTEVTRVTKGFRAAGFDHVRLTVTPEKTIIFEAGTESNPLAPAAPIEGRRKVVL